MKISKLICIVLVCYAFAKAESLQAQSNFKARATYLTQTKLNLNDDNISEEKANDPIAKQIREQLQKGNNQEFTLEMTATESSYTEVMQLAKPAKSGITVRVVASSGSGSFIYKDLEKSTFLKEDQIMGKEFIIEDKLPTYKWVMTGETKKIGAFNCFKATYLPEPEVKEEDKKDDEEEEKKRETGIGSSILSMVGDYDPTITAWYTPEIPINNGPGEYQGLPGLILEVTEGNTVVLLSKIEIDPNLELQIKKPKDGKKIEQEKFNKLRKKKMDEMMEKRGGKNSGVFYRSF